MSKMMINIEGMSCMHCVKGVENALEKLKDVKSYNVEIGKAEVTGDASKEELKDAIEDIGFDVLDITEE
ncbi:heavy-metal-associated domain-containing protein [Clostridium chrysemydis]|uniref:heavy-metal-associated domain-containing protein n=1 Tax=Clostridium chrysemydis TaxID=2665504 RepID=UPI001883DE52|nr:cation transporter [Clostridium chrysemydis]